MRIFQAFVIAALLLILGLLAKVLYLLDPNHFPV